MNQTGHPEDGAHGIEGRPVERGGFRWTCPFCGLSRVNPSGEESGEQNAITALRSHIVASAGDEHGAANAYPAAFDPATLSDHVVREDEG